MQQRFNLSEVHHNWSPLSLIEVNRLFQNLSIPWWIAGGIALDLFVGFPIREHRDIDVGLFRDDQLIIQDYLAEWDLHEAGLSRLTTWRQGKFLELGINQIWCRPTPYSPWALEIMFMEREGDFWLFRREPRVRGRINRLIHHNAEGIPYLSPEIQLLFKARDEIHAKDAQDFQAVLPRLNEFQRHWLISSLKVVFPSGHRWIDML